LFNNRVKDSPTGGSLFFLQEYGNIDPTGGLVTFSTYFPFFSPIVAYSKFVMGEISTVELLISGAVLVLSIGLISYAASRIYVKGVMVYGEKFKWSQLSAMFKK
jgi:ABC-2 type transport system permease protein